MNPAPVNLIWVDIADATQQIFAGSCRSIVAPAALGEVCILPRHAPFLTKLLPGIIKLKKSDGAGELFYVSGGYMEVQRSEVTVLADQMVRAAHLDLSAAMEAKQRAEEILKKSRLFSERDEAKLELIKALAQLRVLEQIGLRHPTSRPR